MLHRFQRLSRVPAATAFAIALAAAAPPGAHGEDKLSGEPDSSSSEEFYRVEDEKYSTRELSDRTLALLSDIDSNPAFSERTKEILGEQVRSGFEGFAQASPGDTSLSPNEFEGVSEGQFSLESVFLVEPFSGQVVTADCSASPCAIPEVWDIEVDRVYLSWKVISSAALAKLEEYINGPGADGRSMKVSLNGVELTQAANLTSPGDFRVYTSQTGCGTDHLSPCMVTVFRRHAWYPAPPPWPAWNVSIELWGTEVLAVPIVDVDEWGNPITISSVQVLEGVRNGTVEPRPYLQSFWTDTIGASTLSQRCTTCHDMDTTQKIYARHNGTIDGTPVVQEPSILVPGKSVLHCYNCHEVSLPYLGPGSSFPENKWATPTPELDINWAQIINDHPNTWPSEICGRMISNMPTAALRQQHFHGDARLFWAVATGDLPVPKLGQSLPTASPHDHTEFLRRFDIWNERGAHCP
jgi:hypothetical protein